MSSTLVVFYGTLGCHKQANRHGPAMHRKYCRYGNDTRPQEDYNEGLLLLRVILVLIVSIVHGALTWCRLFRSLSPPILPADVRATKQEFGTVAGHHACRQKKKVHLATLRMALQTRPGIYSSAVHYNSDCGCSPRAAGAGIAS